MTRRTTMELEQSHTTTERERQRVIITLVHGTFARDAPWTRPGSPLHSSLSSAFDGAAQIESFSWSGRNRFTDRTRGADELAVFLRQQRLRIPGAAQILIADSHGGSVVAYVLVRYPDVATTIDGAAFLATPFIDARPRPDWSLIASVTTFALGLCISAVLIAVGFSAMFAVESVALSLVIWAAVLGVILSSPGVIIALCREGAGLGRLLNWLNPSPALASRQDATCSCELQVTKLPAHSPPFNSHHG